jgi:hypothetical protein
MGSDPIDSLIIPLPYLLRLTALHKKAYKEKRLPKEPFCMELSIISFTL